MNLSPLSLLFAGLLTFGPLECSANDDASLLISSLSGSKVVTLTDLSELDPVSFTTSTIWTDGDMRFEGVPLKSLLKSHGISTGIVRATALNDYSIDIPVAELGDDTPIVAIRLNGEYMSRRKWGPFWIVYPYDSSDDFRNEVTYARSIWQLRELSFVD